MAGDPSLISGKTKNKFPCPQDLPVYPAQITTNTIKPVPSHQENSGTTDTFLGIQATIQPNPSLVNRSCQWHLGHQVVLNCTKDPQGLGQVPWAPVQAGSLCPFIYIQIYICKLLSCVQLSATPWTIVHQAPLFMVSSRQEYWSGLPFPSPGDLPDPGSNPGLPHCRWILYQLSYQGILSPCMTQLILNSTFFFQCHFTLAFLA